MLRTTVLETIRDVSEEDWDSLVPGDQGLCRYRVLRAVEEGGIVLACNGKPLRCFYVLVSDRTGLVGCAALYLMAYAVPMLVPPRLGRPLERIRRRFPRLLEFTSLECGCMITMGNTICLRPGPARGAVLEAILDAIDGLARRLGTSTVLVRDYTRAQLEAVGLDETAMRARGFRTQLSVPIATLNLRWASFDQYVGAMRYGYRRHVLRRSQRARERGMEIVRVDDYASLADDIERLFRNMADRASLRRELIPSQFFRTFAADVGKMTYALVIRDGRGVCGIVTCLVDDGAVRLLYGGVDYALNDDGLVYYSLLYAVVQDAVASGARAIDFGIANDAKMQLGCTATDQVFFMKHMSPLLNAVLLRAPAWRFPGGPSDCQYRVFRGAE